MVFDPTIPKRKSHARAKSKNTSAALKNHLSRVKHPNENKILSPLKSLIIEDLPMHHHHHPLLEESSSIFIKDDTQFNTTTAVFDQNLRYHQQTKLPSVIHVKQESHGKKRMWSRHYQQSHQHPQTANAIGDDSLSETSDNQELQYIHKPVVQGPISLQRRFKASRNKRKQQYAPRLTQQYRAVTQKQSMDKSTFFNGEAMRIPQSSFVPKVMTAKGKDDNFNVMGGGFRAHTQNVMRQEIIAQIPTSRLQHTHEPSTIAINTPALSRNGKTICTKAITTVNRQPSIIQQESAASPQPTLSHRESFRGAQLHKRSWGAGFNQENQQKQPRHTEQSNSPFRVMSIARNLEGNNIQYLLPGALHLSSSIGFSINEKLRTSQSPKTFPANLGEQSIKMFQRKSPKTTRMKRSIQVWATTNSQDDSMLDYSKNESSLDDQHSAESPDTQRELDSPTKNDRMRLNQPTGLQDIATLDQQPQTTVSQESPQVSKQRSHSSLSAARMKFNHSNISSSEHRLSPSSKCSKEQDMSQRVSQRNSTLRQQQIFGKTSRAFEEGSSRDQLDQKAYKTMVVNQQRAPFIQIEDSTEDAARALVASAAGSTVSSVFRVSHHQQSRSPLTAPQKALKAKRSVRQGASNAAWFTQNKTQTGRAKRGQGQMQKINQTMERFADLLQEEKQKLEHQAFNTTQ